MVKGIDLQHTIAKTLDSERVQEIGKQQLESAQRQFARELRNQASRKLRTAQEAHESEETKIRDDEAKKERRRKKEGNRDHRPKEKANPEDDPGDDGCGKIIDIKA